eukprot:5092746-Prorocentrum_lima.AAC.1
MAMKFQWSWRLSTWAAISTTTQIQEESYAIECQPATSYGNDLTPSGYIQIATMHSNCKHLTQWH